MKGKAKSGQKSPTASSQGQKFSGYFVPPGKNPYETVQWVKRSSSISGAAGEKVFEMKDIMVPEEWSQLATDIAVSKYFRKAGVPQTGHETSAKQLVHRVAHSIRVAGENLKNYFATKEDAERFENDLAYLLLTQRAAFNSPVWFNCGLYQEYKIEGFSGNYRWDFDKADIVETKNAYEHPQCSACFIQSVDDDLMSIFDLAKQEARIFKYGSGTGTNFSKIRGAQEKLSGGGQSSGLMSFLEVLDRGAGATKSGGTTRRAAKMVCLDMDHPEIVDFINWKVREEKKVAALVAQGYTSDFNGEAYKTVAGQNSNNSVRISDQFMEAAINDLEWNTRARRDGSIVETLRAKDLWDQVGYAAWACADPGVQFDSTIQKWHTCPATDRINASNPCSEYMFLDDTACNLSSLNLVKFLKEDGSFDVEAYREANRIMFTAQEILVDFSSYPTAQIARNSHDYRPLGLGYANLGTLLMIKGIPYDSEAGRAWAGLITAIMHGEAFRASAEMAAAKGAFPGYSKNREPMLRVMGQHRSALADIKPGLAQQDLYDVAQEVWDETIELGQVHGFRNAQATVLAPTGTIGLLMDCDTTGVEPDFSLVKFKKLAGGGYFKIVNQSVPLALKNLGYNHEQINEIVQYATGTNSLDDAPHINTESLKARGLNDSDIQKINKALPAAMDMKSTVAPWVLGDEGMARLGLKTSELGDQNVVEKLGFTAKQIEEASKIICGSMTLEGAPHLKPEHLAVFDCANKCGPYGERFIEAMGHVRMMAAVQPFLSGAISKTVNLPHESTVKDIQDTYVEAWKLGLKAIAVYRDGCKMSQPLNSSEKKKETANPDAIYTKKDLDEAIKQALSLAPSRRREMPKKRYGFTVEGRVGGHQVYLRTGEYKEGQLGEIFIDMHKEGATFRSLLNCFAISVSMGLQYGVPLEEYVNKFTFTRFEPQGTVDHPNIKQATSILDFIFRVLGMEYLGQTEFVHVKPASEDLTVNRGGSRGDDATAVPAQPQMNLPLESALSEKLLEIAEMQKSIGSQGASKSKSALSAHLSTMMGDAPFCSDCGHTTVRSGSCYKCMNCGNSMGCS
ncbi:MAG: vitamin B12-dependent ribonucleotide reductase [Bdellovibrionales bacterium]